jgi:hypothetical protein
LTQHPVGRAVVDHPLFREECNHALTRQDAARWGDLGTYRAWPSTQIQPDGPSPCQLKRRRRERTAVAVSAPPFGTADGVSQQWIGSLLVCARCLAG